MSVVYLLGGLILLVLGAEGLVRGGGRLALILRVPAAVVGFTLVAWGTSAPELVVSVTAAIEASTDMALGNVLGSSVANIALVLALSAMIAPLPPDRGVSARDYWALVVSQLVLVVMVLDGDVGRLDGILLVLLGVVYNVDLVRRTRRSRSLLPAGPIERPRRPWPAYVAVALAGVALLAVGSNFFVVGASDIARAFGMSDRVVGLTIVAVGTSTPELATSLVASFRGQHDVSVGNVVGSNFFNTVFALGITAIVLPVPFPVGANGGAAVDLGLVVLLTLAIAPVLVRQRRVTRAFGATLFAVYVAWLAFVTMT